MCTDTVTFSAAQIEQSRERERRLKVNSMDAPADEWNVLLLFSEENSHSTLTFHLPRDAEFILHGEVPRIYIYIDASNRFPL
jgi:hypothetical protein